MASSTIPLSEIPTLSLLYKLNKLTPSPSPLADATSRFNSKISLIRTDITKLRVTAIVNAANESLLGGGGVDGAIHRAAGPDLVEECRYLDGCDTGDAKMTKAYELPCEKVIHAVGPVYYSAKRKGAGEPERLLGGCYKKALQLLVQAGGGSLAFSALSTGVYGYPSMEAAEVAVKTVKTWLEEDEERAQKVERIVFCQFMEKDEKAYEEVIPMYFPPAAEEEVEEEGEKAEGKEVMEENTTAEAEKKEAGVEKQEGEADKVPDLPDVPTKEPTEPDQPEPKKQKLDDGKD